jgi:Protein of unknown function (DUF3618)
MTVYEKSPDQIEREIKDTRAEIDRTLGALQYKLSPGQLLDQALGYLKGGPGEFTANLGRSLRDNPLPVTLLGVSLGWLMLAPRSGAYATGAAETHPSSGVSDTAEEAMESARDLGDKARDELHAQRVKVEAYAQHAWDRGKRVTQKAEDYGQQAWDQSKRATHAAGRFFEEYPLAIAALGLAIGAAAAASLPRGRREDELLGEASDRLKHAMQKTVSESAAMTEDVGAKARHADEEAERKLGRMGELSGSEAATSPTSTEQPPRTGPGQASE